LVYSYLACALFVDHTEHRLVLLLVNRELLLHFARLRVKQ